jgi:hypothetical protein
VPWGGFTAWGDVSFASLMAGLSWVLVFGGTTLFLSWGWAQLIGLYKVAAKI